jgi:hypothetical protein
VCSLLPLTLPIGPQKALPPTIKYTKQFNSFQNSLKDKKHSRSLTCKKRAYNFQQVLTKKYCVYFISNFIRN